MVRLHRQEGGKRRFLGIVDREHHLILRIERHLVDPRRTAGRNRIRDRHRLHVDELQRAVAVACPRLIEGGGDAVGTGLVPARLAVLHHPPDEAGNAADEPVLLGVEDVDGPIALVGEEIAPARLVDEADVPAQELLTGYRHSADLLELRRLRG